MKLHDTKNADAAARGYMVMPLINNKWPISRFSVPNITMSRMVTLAALALVELPLLRLITQTAPSFCLPLTILLPAEPTLPLVILANTTAIGIELAVLYGCTIFAPVAQHGAGHVRGFDAVFATTHLSPSSLAFDDSKFRNKNLSITITNKSNKAVQIFIDQHPCLCLLLIPDRLQSACCIRPGGTVPYSICLTLLV